MLRIGKPGCIGAAKHNSGLLIIGVWLILAAAGAQAAEVIKSPNDSRSYQYLTLSNKLDVLLVSDPETDKAAASLDVFVGSNDDPVDRNGLAHFLEHMLFLGTAKYPEPDAYQSFISQNGGSHNAYTSGEHTNYFFDVNHASLESALDRFAQFFIAPLFSEEYVNRERKAVHSEYRARIKNTYRRELDVLRELANPKHPIAKFSVGSQNTLADRDDDAVRDDLLQFYKDYYSSDQMTLVVLGRESLNELRQMVEKRFVAVPLRQSLEKVSGVRLFKRGFLPAKVEIKPLKDERRLNMMFPVDSSDIYYREKPLRYLGNILGHEGEGSLFALLKSLGWAEGLSAGGGMGGRNQGSFVISVQLTPEGYINRDKIVELTFKQIRKLRNRGIQKWRFRELRSLAEIDFRFAEKTEPQSLVRSLSNQMHRYDSRDIIRGPYLYTKFDSILLRRYLSRLTRDNMLLVVSAPEVSTDRVSALYNTSYRVQPLRKSDISVEGLTERLDLPAKNNFVPARLKIKPIQPGAAGDTPQRIGSRTAIKAWHQQDGKFNVPKSMINVRVFSPLVSQGPRQAAMAQLFVRLVDDDLNEFAYPAALAGLGYSLSAHSRGMDMRVSGYSDRQGLLLDKVLTSMRKRRFDRGRLETIKAELIRSWQNQKQLTPYEQLFRKVPALLYEPYWDELELAEQLQTVTAEELANFSLRIWAGSEIRALFYGNLFQQEAQKLAALIEDRLHTDGSANLELAAAQVVNLPRGEQRYHLPVDHQDSVAALYVQASDVAPRDRAMMRLIQQSQKSKFFHQLRTEQQLGYIVFLTGYGLKDVESAVFMVQSPTAKVAEIEKAIKAFVNDHAGNVDDFEKHKNALLTNLEEQPKNLTEQNARFWSEILAGRYDFKRRQELIDAIKDISADQLSIYSRRQLGNPEGIWLTAGPGQPVADAVDFKAFKSDSEKFTFDN